MLLLEISLFSALATCVTGWMWYTFGDAFAVIAGMLCVLPGMLYYQMRTKGQSATRRDWAKFGGMLLLAMSVLFWLAWAGFNENVHIHQRFERDVADFNWTIVRDGRFRNVHADFPHRKGGRAYLKGTVATEADHQALIPLAEKAFKYAESGYHDGIIVHQP